MNEPGALLAAMRTKRPLVQCITNYVAMQIAANVLLAAGASPAMVHAPEESGDFAAVADALTINIGTLSPHWVLGMTLAADSARKAGRPWVFDPVAVFASDFRREAASRLLALKPTVIRGNASEILALAGAQAAGQGADAGDAVEAAAEPAIDLARRTGAVVAVTGPVDFVTDGARVARVAGGAAVMPQVTALGCALTGLVGGFVAACEDAFEATVAALAFYGVAGERAAAIAGGPGGFPPAFLDMLAALTPAELDAGARIA